jgi:hypothetical protein
MARQRSKKGSNTSQEQHDGSSSTSSTTPLTAEGCTANRRHKDTTLGEDHTTGSAIYPGQSTQDEIIRNEGEALMYPTAGPSHPNLQSSCFQSPDTRYSSIVRPSEFFRGSMDVAGSGVESDSQSNESDDNRGKHQDLHLPVVPSPARSAMVPENKICNPIDNYQGNHKSACKFSSVPTNTAGRYQPSQQMQIWIREYVVSPQCVSC